MTPVFNFCCLFFCVRDVGTFPARLHALALGKDIPNRTKEDTVALMQIMDWLEGQKPKVGEDKDDHQAVIVKYVETVGCRLG